jgi:hypothetical protein
MMYFNALRTGNELAVHDVHRGAAAGDDLFPEHGHWRREARLPVAI